VNSSNIHQSLRGFFTDAAGEITAYPHSFFSSITPHLPGENDSREPVVGFRLQRTQKRFCGTEREN
jgi:hypothetical protein